MDLQNQNGTAVKNETAKAAATTNQNGAAKKDNAGNGPKPQPSATEQAKPQQTPAPAESATVQADINPAKPELSLDAKLQLVGDLHRRSVQRINLISRIRQLEAFEVALAQEGDELNDNPYQGCKLIIRDDKHREFITSTPGLIRMVAQYIFAECNVKLREIESTINFPKL